jgi:TRAP-type mannitol/chloroaromatic compound transport system permease small subunit
MAWREGVDKASNAGGLLLWLVLTLFVGAGVLLGLSGVVVWLLRALP